MTAARRSFQKLFPSAVAIAAANVVYLLAFGSYDARLGPLHLVAHGVFKPLLILNGAFVLAALLRKPERESPLVASADAKLPAVLFALGALALTFSFSVNPLYDEWNYRGLSSTYKTIGDVARLFASSQIGVWYRPLGFVSLWVDHALFHEHVWAYHLQNILLHLSNALLASVLAKRLGMADAIAHWVAPLYLAAAVTYEPMMWPSARFDLLAMLFTTLALIAALRFVNEAGSGSGAFLWAAPACYALAVASKESGYAFPALLAIAAIARPPANKRRLIPLGAGIVVVTGAMLAIRHAVLGGAGGYPGSGSTPSIHLSFSLSTLRIVLARTLQMSMLSVNLTYPAPKWVLAAVGAFAVLLAVAAITGVSATPKQRVLVAYVFAATLPVAPLVSWLDQSAQHVRYLYMPAAFVMMFVAAALANSRWPALLLSAFVLLNLSCGVYNAWAYKSTYQHSRDLADGIASDSAADSSPALQPIHLEVLNMPEEFNGVLFSRFEFEYRLQEKLPGAVIRFENSASCSIPACYVWDPEQRSLHLR